MLIVAIFPILLLISGANCNWSFGSPSHLPITAWRAGFDWNSRSMFIGRVSHGGDIRVATVTRMNDGSNLCRYSVGGQSFICPGSFEVFTGSGVSWQSDSNGSVPRGAIFIGGARDHYIGRLSPEFSWDIGTVDRHNRALFYSSFNGNNWTERWSRTYQVLCF